jgi:hypothetical protein
MAGATASPQTAGRCGPRSGRTRCKLAIALLAYGPLQERLKTPQIGLQLDF